jgi:hypothetical protein
MEEAMLTPQEQVLRDYLLRYFGHLMLSDRTAPSEPSLQILVRTLAWVLAVEMGARGLTERDLTRVVDPWCRLLKTWTREAYVFAMAQRRANERP